MALYKVVLTFESVDKILKCHLRKSLGAVLYCGGKNISAKVVLTFWSVKYSYSVAVHIKAPDQFFHAVKFAAN